MKNEKRLVLFFESEKEYRYKRISEEANRINLPIFPINIYNVTITEDRLFYLQEEIHFRETDTFWALSNASINHAIERFLELHSFSIWPSAESIKFSDKFYSNTFFSRIGISTPKTCLLSSLNNIVSIAAKPFTLFFIGNR